MLIWKEQDRERNDLQALADQFASTLIAPLQCKQDAIDIVRSRKLYCVIDDANTVCVGGSGERRQQITPDFPSAGLLQNARLGERFSDSQSAMTIARSPAIVPCATAFLRVVEIQRCEASNKKRPSKPKIIMVPREKSEPDFARNRNRARLKNARDQNDMTDRTWKRAETIVLGAVVSSGSGSQDE